MTYITPNTSLEFFPDLGLSLDLENTFYFASTAAKDAYFAGLTKLATAAACSYQRGTRGIARVQVPISSLYGCGYMRYKNTSFENKWIYAFVTNVEYINNEVTEVYFSIDPVMTWIGDYTLGQCFVEREHTLSDNIGEHLIDEGLSVGDYVVNNVDTITPFSPVLIIGASVKNDGQSTDLVNVDGAVYYGNMVSGLDYQSYSLRSTTDVQNALAHIANIVDKSKKDAVISMRIVPAFCAPIPNANPLGSDLTVNNGGTFASQYAVTQLDGYTPANKKMLSYPYIKYEVINGEGSANEYRLELFANALTPSFMYRGVSFDNCEVMLIPQGYRDAGLNLLYDEAMVMRDFPQASFDIDQYKAYLAQLTSGGGWLNIAGSLIGDLTQAAKGDTGGAAMGLLGQAMDLLRDNIYYESLPPAVKGTSNANIMAAMGVKSFIGYHKSIMSERAQSIDRYFSMYGYRVNMVKTPSCNNRPQWTYVKTSGCIVHGNIPASAAREIEAAFNRGIRFWANPANIGNYSLNNAPGA